MTEPANKITSRHLATNFSDEQALAVKTYGQTGDMDKAAKASGLAVEDIKLLLYRRDAAAIIREESANRIANMVPKALSRLDEGSEKGATPDRGQLDAVKTILDRAGMIAPKASEATNHNPEMQEMSEHELRTIATQALGEIAIRGVPSAPPLEGQVIDMLD